MHESIVLDERLLGTLERILRELRSGTRELSLGPSGFIKGLMDRVEVLMGHTKGRRAHRNQIQHPLPTH